MEVLLERDWLPRSQHSAKKPDTSPGSGPGRSFNESAMTSNVRSACSTADVLDITEAAIRALNTRSPPNKKSSSQNSFLSLPSTIHSASTPVFWDVRDRDAFEYADRHTFGTEESQVTSNDKMLERCSSSGSKSSTASEVLRRSTMAESHEVSLSSARSPHVPVSQEINTSVSSSASKSSLMNSGFITGELKKVKVSSKKLREVHSPFDESTLSQNVSMISNEQTIIRPKEKKKKKSVKLANGTMERTYAGPTGKDTSPGNDRDNSVTPPRVPPRADKPDDELAMLFSPVASSSKAQNPSNHMKNMAETATEISPDLIYSVENHVSPNRARFSTVIKPETIHIRTVKSPSNTPNLEKNRTEKSQIKSLPYQDVMQESKHHNSDIDVLNHGTNITAIERHEKCAETEIVTVHEKIVTVQAKDRSLENSSMSSMTTDSDSLSLPVKRNAIPPKGPHWRLLLQGAPVEGTDPSSMRNTEDTQIVQYQLTDKQKMLRSGIAKSRQVSAPVKRYVQPRIVPSASTEETKQMSNSTSQADAVTTAAVAASAAVAATQPFLQSTDQQLQAQHEVELKMTEILARLAVLQAPSVPAMANASKNNNTSLESQRIAQLERQIQDLTQKRLDHLEQMQNQYMTTQAQLLGISRSKPEETSGVLPDKQQHFTSPHKAKFKPVHRSPEQGSRRIEKEILNTPAPRRAAPIPALYEAPPPAAKNLDHDTPVKLSKPKGLLETILAETPQSAHQETPSGRQEDRSNVTSDLVSDLETLKARMNRVLDDVASVNVDLKHRSPAYPIQASLAYSPPDFKDAPLDIYLQRNMTQGLSSPYPSVTREHGNAPVRENFTDAKNVLNTVRQSRHVLEANLQAIWRSRQETDVFALLNQINSDSSAAEKLRIRKLVDKQIDMMKSDLEREILEELMKMREAEEYDDMIPERDMNQGKAGAGRLRGKTQSKTDSGLKKGITRGEAPARRTNVGAARPGQLSRPAVTRPAPAVTRPAPAVTRTAKSAAKPAKAKDYETEEYMTRVYGKAEYQQHRTSMKSTPYLHYQTSPKSKHSRPAPRVAANREQNREHYYFSQQLQDDDMGVMHGQLIQMAIPLGKPRQEKVNPRPTPLVPVTPQASSTPLTRTPQQITVINVRDDSDEERHPSPAKQHHKPTLAIQTLGMVDIAPVELQQDNDTDQEEEVLPPTVPFFHYHEHENEEVLGSESTEEDDANRTLVGDAGVAAEDEDGEDAIILPGYQAEAGVYHGPQFPPAAPALTDPSSDVLAGDLQRSQLLHTQATHWLEQELMARILSEIAMREAPPQPAVQASLPYETHHSPSSSSTYIMDAIGEQGLQMFVEMGMDVDDKLIGSLIQEVIMEKVHTALGYHPDRRPAAAADSAEARTVSPVPKPRQRPSITPRQQSLHEQREVETPIPTPEGSLLGSQVSSDRSEVYTPDPSVSEKDEQPASDTGDEQEEHIQPGTDFVVESKVSTPPLSPQASPRTVETPEPSREDSPPRHKADVGVATDMPAMFQTLGFQPVYQPTGWQMYQPVVQPVPVLAMQPPVSQQPAPMQADTKSEEVTPPASETASTPAASPQPWGNPDSPVSEAAPPLHSHTQMLRDKGPEKPQTVERAVSPVSNTSSTSHKSHETTMSDTCNNISEGQWLISVYSEGEMRTEFPVLFASSVLQERREAGENISIDDTLLTTEDIEQDELSVGEINHREQLLSNNTLLAMVSQLQHRPLTYVEQQLRGRGPYTTATDRRAAKMVAQPWPTQAKSLPYNLRVPQQQLNPNDHSPGEYLGEQHPLTIQSTVTSQDRPSTSRGRAPPHASFLQGGAPYDQPATERDHSASRQTASRSTTVQGTRQDQAHRPATQSPQAPLRLADMKKRGGLGSAPIMSTSDISARSRGRGARPRPATQDSRDTLAGSLSGATFSHDSADFLNTTDSIHLTGRTLNASQLDYSYSGTGMETMSARDLETPDQMYVDNLADYLVLSHTQSDLDSGDQQTGQFGHSLDLEQRGPQDQSLAHNSGHLGLTQTVSQSAQFTTTLSGTDTYHNDRDLRMRGHYLDSLETSLDTDQLVMHQPHTINSSLDGIDVRATMEGTLLGTGTLNGTTGSGVQGPRHISLTIPSSSGHPSSPSDEDSGDISELSLTQN